MGEITDSVAPTFSNFPGDRLIRCNESPDPANTGRPEASDACAGTITPTYNDVSRQEPDERLCPGDTIITRTWTIVDDCGNVFTRDQIITITLPVGECIPTACPPCDDVQCCESSLASPAPCEPVYIYVFDDDEDPATFSQPVNPGPETQNSASVLSISFVILALLALLI